MFVCVRELKNLSILVVSTTTVPETYERDTLDGRPKRHTGPRYSSTSPKKTKKNKKKQHTAHWECSDQALPRTGSEEMQNEYKESDGKKREIERFHSENVRKLKDREIVN